MIVWINKEATGRPNDQRAEIERVEDGRDTSSPAGGLKIHVKMLGDGMILAVRLTDICKIELPTGGSNISVAASVTFGGFNINKHSNPQLERVWPEESDEFRRHRLCHLAEYFLDNFTNKHEQHVVLLDAIWAIPDRLVPIEASLRHEAHGLVNYLLALARGDKSKHHLQNYPALREHLDNWWEQYGAG